MQDRLLEQVRGHAIYEGDLQVIALDVEGCLGPADRGALSLRSLSGVRTYCRRAPELFLPPIILVTGRGEGTAERVIQEIGAIGEHFRYPSVIENGALLYDHNERFSRPTKAVEEKYESVAAVRRFIDGPFRDEYKNQFRKESGKEICISLDPKGISVEELRDILETELERGGLLKSVDVRNSKSAVDITPAGASKLNGLREALGSYGDLQNVLGVGDSGGDREWLESVGARCAPANATKELLGIHGLVVSKRREARGVEVFLSSVYADVGFYC